MDTLTTVQSRTYRLVQPGIMEEFLIDRVVRENEVVIEPTLSSICHADLRYYTGKRRPEALKKKLPMALLHEGVGTIVASKAPDLKPGQRVLIVPNIPGYLLDGVEPEDCCPACSGELGENYCQRGRFLGSGYDGIAQSRLVMPAKSVLPIPDEVPDNIAVLAELISVSYQAIKHLKDSFKTAKVAVFGDGPVGYLTSSLIHYLFRVETERLLAFGAIAEKLNEFQFAKRALVQDYDFDNGEKVDIAIECTGGHFSSSAVNQAIQMMNPGGRIILMGVTEELVSINTRDVLEKGLILVGSSRSTIPDYPPVVEAMKNPQYQKALKRLLPTQVIGIHSIEDLKQSFDETAEHRDWKKTVLDFHW
ncbi:alcohol dehydrogenase catalytic domain-containing protein [Paenibacillus alkaliterrae]